MAIDVEAAWQDFLRRIDPKFYVPDPVSVERAEKLVALAKKMSDFWDIEMEFRESFPVKEVMIYLPQEETMDIPVLIGKLMALSETMRVSVPKDGQCVITLGVETHIYAGND